MLLNNNYNPDVLTCLANLSNDEVFTPPTVVNQMLDMLPAELFRSHKTTFLDPVSKSGVFLREIAKRLMIGLEQEIPDVHERANHIFRHQLFGIAITELTSLLSRRSVYCSKKANGKYSLCTEFNDEQGNIRYKNIEHTFVKGSCKYCGAAESVFGPKVRAELESHAYEFIHTDNPQKLFKNMKFDVIIGNPPYQLSDGGGNGASAMPIYQKFVEQAQKLTPRYLTMIIPARWYSGGKGLDEFRNAMLNDRRLRYLVDYSDSRDCFSNVDIAGGVCYFLWDRDHEGICSVKTIKKNIEHESERYLNEYNTFIRDYEALNIIRKVQSNSDVFMDSVVYSRNPYGFASTADFFSEKKEGFIPIMTSKGDLFVPRNEIKANNDTVLQWKVVLSKASAEHAGQVDKDGRRKILSRTQILPPDFICSESYLLLSAFETKGEAENMLTYVKTRFFRYLLSTILLTQNISKDKFQFVPLQDFSHPWTDEMLYKKYNLTEDEIAFIESMIRPME